MKQRLSRNLKAQFTLKVKKTNSFLPARLLLLWFFHLIGSLRAHANMNQSLEANCTSNRKKKKKKLVNLHCVWLSVPWCPRTVWVQDLFLFPSEHVDCVLFILQHLWWNKVSNYQNNESNSCWAKKWLQIYNILSFHRSEQAGTQTSLENVLLFFLLFFLMNVPQWLHSGFALFFMYPYNKSEWWSVCLFCLRWSCPCPDSLYCASIHRLCLFSVRIQNKNLFFFFN